MHKNYQMATALRREGKSYNEINKILRIPKSTLCGWFAKTPWSKIIKNHNVNRLKDTWRANLIKAVEKRRIDFNKRVVLYRTMGQREFPYLKKNRLFIAGLMLYWGEGDNTLKGPTVRLSNANPYLIRLFVKFLIDVCKLSKEKIRPALILYPDLNDLTCKKFWSKITSIPLTQFYKTQYIKGKSQKRTLTHGICMIYSSNRELKEKILVWIDLLQKDLSKK